MSDFGMQQVWLPHGQQGLHLLQAKFIFYATYLSEKIVPALRRHLRRLEQNPDNQIFPIFVSSRTGVRTKIAMAIS